MLTGQTKPTFGEAWIAGYNIIHESIKAKESIGVVPEVSNVYDEMSAWENLIFSAELYDVPRSERSKRAIELLKFFGLYERKEDKVANFSKGMKRRLTIATALIHKPKVIFLDEPTTGLDVQSSRMIRILLKQLNKTGVTIFLTTHYIEEADQLCHRIAIINKGKIIALGSPEELKTKAEEEHIIEISFSISKDIEEYEDIENQLKNLNYVNSISRIGDKFRLYVENTSEVIPIIIDFCRKNNLKIISINTLKPSLEDAFVKITGLSPEIMKIEKEAKKSVSLG
jgi:ABC-2 type transport system ATP-binding protein